MPLVELIDDNLVPYADIDVKIVDEFSVDNCTYKAGDQVVIFSPRTGESLLCDSVVLVFLSLLRQKSPLVFALSAFSECHSDYARNLLNTLENMEFIEVKKVNWR